MTQDQKIGEIEVGLDQLQSAFELLEETVRGWRNGVQLLREGGVEIIKIRGGVDGLMGTKHRLPQPPKVGVECEVAWIPPNRVGVECEMEFRPPPRVGAMCELGSLVDDYIDDVRVVVRALFEALERVEGRGGGPVDPGGSPL
jgi:hypothetical protein